LGKTLRELEQKGKGKGERKTVSKPITRGDTLEGVRAQLVERGRKEKGLTKRVAWENNGKELGPTGNKAAMFSTGGGRGGARTWGGGVAEILKKGSKQGLERSNSK